MVQNIQMKIIFPIILNLMDCHTNVFNFYQLQTITREKFNNLKLKILLFSESIAVDYKS